MKGDSAFPHHSFALGMVLNGFPAFPAPPADRHPLPAGTTYTDVSAGHWRATFGVWAFRGCDPGHSYVYITGRKERFCGEIFLISGKSNYVD